MKTITFDEARWKLVPIERSYDMRAKAIIAFNTAEQAGRDRDDALGAAFRAELEAAPTPPADGQPGIKSIDEFEQKYLPETWAAKNPAEALIRRALDGPAQPDTQAIRDVALEEAAKAAMDAPLTANDEGNKTTQADAWHIAARIRALKSQPEVCAQDGEKKPSLFNPLTPYGLLVRALRIIAGTTLMEMAQFVGRTPAQLSDIEFGRAPLTDEMACFVHRFFHDRDIGVTLELLRAAARAAKERT